MQISVHVYAMQSAEHRVPKTAQRLRHAVNGERAESDVKIDEDR